MKVLLLNPPRSVPVLNVEEDKLSLLYLAAALEQKNIEVHVCDAIAEARTLKNVGSLIKTLRPDVVGITVTTPTRFDAFNTARIIKQIDRKIVVVAGGPHITSVDPSDTLGNIADIDIAVFGEAEETLTSLIDAISMKNEFSNISGISFRAGNTITTTPHAARIKNLDSLPFPARHLLKKYQDKRTEEYTTPIQLPDGSFLAMPTATIITGRGCPFNCLFCAAAELWERTVTIRSPESIVRELTHMHGTFGITAFRFCDDTFNLSKQRVLSICNAISGSGLSMRWHCHVRADKIDRETLEAMRDTGCFAVSMGVESGSPRVLSKIIDKQITLDSVRKAVKLFDEFGIHRSLNFIYSLPGETREDVDLTLALAKELGGIQPMSPTVIFPGSRLEQIAREKGILGKTFRWSKISDYRWYDPTSRNFLPIYVEKLRWEEILDIFYFYITNQSGIRTSNYIARILLQILQIRSLLEAKILIRNYWDLFLVLMRNF